MFALRKALLFGVLIWLIAFAVAFAIFPLRETSRPLFESIMPVALALATVFFAARYFEVVESRFVSEGFLLGIIWMAVNLGIDLPLMLSPSPMQMTPGEYLGDIGLTYLLLPVITTGMGVVAAQREVRSAEDSVPPLQGGA